MEIRKPINEIYIIRLVACLSVVMIHSLSMVRLYRDISEQNVNLVISLQMALMYATPMFVLISEFISANIYYEKVPKGFLLNKIKYILIPYIFMAGFYTLNLYIKGVIGIHEFLLKWKSIMLGEWHGYFVIIIFQFYFLHIFYVKFLKKINPAIVLITSLIISIGYWVYFSFFFVYSYEHFYQSFVLPKILFVGWLFYFSVAFYCGKDYGRFKTKLNQYKYWVLLGFLITFGYVQFNYHNKIYTDIASTRFDIVFYTVMVFFLLFFIASKIKKIPYWILSISSFSYGIYLLHPFIQEQVLHYFEGKAINGLTYVVIQFLAGALLPIVIVYLVAKLPFGEFIVGKLKFPKKG